MTNVQEDVGSLRWPETLPSVPPSWANSNIPDQDDPIWSSVKALFNLPWFRRVWIIQEIVAAPTVRIICGKWNIDWNDLHSTMEIIDQQLQLYSNDMSRLRESWEPFLSLAAQREWEARQYRWILFMLLENFRYAESTLSRDRSFALLGLASDGNEEEFEPDYESTLEEIVLRFARVFVRQGRGIQLLYRAGLTHEVNRFPSWIPDWTVKRPQSLHESSEIGIPFAASGSMEANMKLDANTDELEADGYEVDFVESLSQSSNIEQEWPRYFEEIDEMLDAANLNPVPDSLEELRWKVPIAGAMHPKLVIPGTPGLKCSYNALRKYLRNSQKGKEVEGSGCPSDGATLYAQALDSTAVDAYQTQSMSYTTALKGTLHKFRFTVTRKGYVGVVPYLTQVGDLVSIVKGARVPFVLRASATRSGCFRLVGECYINDLMNGRSLSLQGIVQREFRLH